ncbi:class I SAM-dependent methyltransferase [Halorubrum laminariae]|uniref:Class I SAM-dependent methyltransferase n=1 Tax=Halorubrum laminariae TaxID=1433523 RepID=A0ABD6C0Y3_9EURY|nr:class I SAM-dependent methyltransferase [Halorubrum laminariae]
MDRFQNTGQPDWDWWSRLWPTPGDTLRRLGLEQGDSTVEIGCGNGYFALPAARIVDPAPVYAVDVDAGLLDELSALAEKQDIETVVPICGDARDLDSHLPEPVDVALLANAFHGIDERDAFLAAVADALAPDGRFVVVNWRAWPRAETTVGGEPRGPPTDLRIGPDETRTAVESATDLRLVREIDLPPYHYGLVFERVE